MAKQFQTYLKQLRFDPKLAQSFKAKYLTNIRVVILFVLFIIVAGVSSYINLPRRLNPEIKIPIVTVTTLLPGAGPSDVESLITIPLEEAVSGVAAVGESNSTSSESLSVITIQFNSGTDPERAKRDVQGAIDTVTTLPADAKTPQVRTFDFEDQPVWTFSLKTNSDQATLERFSEILSEKLKRNPKVNRVETTGASTQELQILIKPEAVALYNINPFTLSKIVQTSIKSFPSGTVNTSASSFPLGLDAFSNSLSDIRNLTLNTGNQQVKLSDIAEVFETAKSNQKTSFYADANSTFQRVVTFFVFKTKTANIDETVKSIREQVSLAIKPYSGLFQVVSVLDLSQRIDQQYGDLLGNFRDTIFLVFLTFLLFLGVRQALVASTTIPLTFLSSFTIMNITGLSLNFLSLFSLLLSLGLLVDDTIVIVTGITSYYRTQKFTPQEAGLLVWRDFIVPIWSTTITTVWAFIPLLLSTGLIGEFIKTIPIVVAATLYSSTSIAVLITLPLMMAVLKLKLPNRVKLLLRTLIFIGLLAIFSTLLNKNPLLPFILIVYIILIAITYTIRFQIKEGIASLFPDTIRRNLKKRIAEYMNHGVINIELISQKYKSMITKILSSQVSRKKVVVVVALIGVFAYILLPLGFVVNEFFPKTKAETIYITTEFPSGTALNVVNQEATNLTEQIRHYKGVTYISTDIGRGIDPSGRRFLSGDNFILVTLVLPRTKKQKISSIDIAKKLRADLANYQKGNLYVVELAGGPPAGADIQIQIIGDDLALLDTYSDRVVEYLKKQSGVVNVNKSVKAGVSKLTFVPDIVKVSDAGVTLDSLGLALRTFTSGITIDTVKFGNGLSTKSQDITFRMNSENPSPSLLSSIQVQTSTGFIPLLSLGHFEAKTNPTMITRHNNKRTITVTAGVVKGYSVSQTNKNLETFASSTLKLPENYSWATGGANEENQKSVRSIFQAMIISAILIFGTMVIQFTSYRQAILVMLVIPIAVSGVFIIFALTGTPLSFPALIGTLSLFGIVVTHAMILVDKINLNRRAGLPFAEAIADAGAARLEPIFLGSLVTILGLIPISLSNPLWQGLGGAIIAGLSFSGVIMLVFIPTVYYMWFGKKLKK